MPRHRFLHNQENDTTAKPLYDPHGDHYSRFEKFLVGTPLIDPKGHLRPSIKEQISRRSEELLQSWIGCEVPMEFVVEVSRMVADEMEWSKPYFLPEDPARLVFWEGNMGMQTLDLQMVLEKRFRIDLRANLSGVIETYGEFIRQLWNAAAEFEGKRARGEIVNEPQLPLWIRIVQRFKKHGSV